jgi:hypothetical protein
MLAAGGVSSCRPSSSFYRPGERQPDGVVKGSGAMRFLDRINDRPSALGRCDGGEKGEDRERRRQWSAEPARQRL